MERADGLHRRPGRRPAAQPALCYGAYRTVLLTNRQYIFERAAEGERVLVSINADSAPYTAHFDAGCGGRWT